MKNEKLTFTCGEGGEAEEFFVVEQTRLNGVTYLLVADSEEDDAECLILKDTSTPEESSRTTSNSARPAITQVSFFLR